jgi:hypothetical protein
LPPLILTVGFPALRANSEASSSRSLALDIAKRAGGREIVCFKTFPSALPFYLGKTVSLITENGTELRSNYLLYRLHTSSDWPSPLIPLRNAQTWNFTRCDSTLFVARASTEAELKALIPLCANSPATIYVIPNQ